VTGRGTLFHDANAPGSWTSFTRTYTATKTNPLLVFAVQGGGNDIFHLDSTSVVDVTSGSGELLDNPGFDSSSGAFDGWNQWCGTSCGNTQSSPAIALSGGSCHSGTCISIYCGSGTDVALLGQYFSATIGDVYNISFWLIYASGGPAGNIYVDVT
jgi:hypothetical protein